MIDPISDMLTRIRNAHGRMKDEVLMPSSKLRVTIADILKKEGYLLDYQVKDVENKKVLLLKLKYYQDKPVMESLELVSKPSLRCYRAVDELPIVKGGLGIAIVSTSKGVMTARAARQMKVGGELLCLIS